MILELLAFILAASCYAVSQAVVHGKFNLYGGEFWNDMGFLRKYNRKGDPYNYGLIYAPNTWYYRWFKIKYKERFPGSATIFVFVTDAYHLFQALFKIFLCLSFAPQIGLIWAGILWVVFGIVFTITYRYVQK